MDTVVENQTLDVLRHALAAFEFLSSDDRATAAELCNLALGASQFGLRGEALIVAAANAGVIALLQDDAAAARQAFEFAAVVISDDDNDMRDVAPRGTSSSYHARLAARHSEAFALARVALRKQHRAVMSTIVNHHLALLDGRSTKARADMCSALDRFFGEVSFESRLARAATRSDAAECYTARTHKLRAVLRYWPVGGCLTPEVAIAALAILPFDSRQLSRRSMTRTAAARSTL